MFASTRCKALPLEELLARLTPLRAAGGIVFTNGCFDLLHAGHVDLLERARALGRVLVVGLNADASVSGLKGPSRPVTAFADRARVLAGLACVDFVTGFDRPTPLELIEAVRPDVLVKGGDWPVESIVGRESVQARGGLVMSLPLLPGYSTTSVIERILALSGHAGLDASPRRD
ncbi:D-glycero-beta-D-manno-heptose 1-phosphate adenylyltransferase [Fundidesulfovibrio agrisoli]|uniref:D-glycero-beta-D-manno-heptose 1-phosphate adenylyltransferase n=1 Tax=Fundidesulfovibrio agrisoli TaxID=2922717 RepID=UPI001FAB64FF|nr:D-glycero-beta-D-manno-heptose 1-phosphate adenylyltransferase [Fundidesulfovibrio agrisoli]